MSLSRTAGSFCGTFRMIVYSSTDRPWSVTAFSMASPASPSRRFFSATGASANCWSYLFLITDTFLAAAAAASSFLSGIFVGVGGLGVITDDGPEGDCCCACAAGTTKRPAAVRVRAHHVPNRVVDCMSKLLLRMCFSQPTGWFHARPAGKNAIHLATPAASIRSRANISSMTRIGFEIDHQVRRFGIVGLKARLGRIGPTGEVHHHAPPAVILLRLDGFHDVQALAVEEEGVTPKKLFELRHAPMPRRNA